MQLFRRKIMEKKEVMKNYKFLAILIGAMVLGAIIGAVAPDFARVSIR